MDRRSDCFIPGLQMVWTIQNESQGKEVAEISLEAAEDFEQPISFRI